VSQPNPLILLPRTRSVSNFELNLRSTSQPTRTCATARDAAAAAQKVAVLTNGFTALLHCTGCATVHHYIHTRPAMIAANSSRDKCLPHRKLKGLAPLFNHTSMTARRAA
jgi:hypothetical protein